MKNVTATRENSLTVSHRAKRGLSHDLTIRVVDISMNLCLAQYGCRWFHIEIFEGRHICTS